MRTTIQAEHNDRTYTFIVECDHDQDMGEPWEESDGHGPVSGWESRNKRAGELVLSADRRGKRFYDYATACRIALRDGWNTAPYDVPGETLRQRAARAAMADYEYLRAWCYDEWQYVGVTVTLMDESGEPTEVTNSLGGVETHNNYHITTAREMAAEILVEMGTAWGEVHKKTYGYIGV